jgi:hypothetical protein
LDQGLLSQESNVLKGRTSLDVKLLQGRLNLDHLGVSRHSFGAATAVAMCNIDKRFKCCVAEDVWWVPIEEVHNINVTFLAINICKKIPFFDIQVLTFVVPVLCAFPLFHF